VDSVLIASPDISFEGAIALTQELLAGLEAEQYTDEATQTTIASLVQSPNGARGFFVTYLTDERPLGDRPTSGVLAALQSAPDTVAPLLTKNLAMSTAMAIAHRRADRESLALGSDRVRSRTARLIGLVNLPNLIQELEALETSIRSDSGPYVEFLERWGYDTEQRQAIQAAIQKVLEP
jgi:hypothetical protein